MRPLPPSDSKSSGEAEAAIPGLRLDRWTLSVKNGNTRETKSSRHNLVVRRDCSALKVIQNTEGRQCFDAVGWVSGRASGP